MHTIRDFFNENIEYTFDSNIVEYDMIAANLSVIKALHLLDVPKIQQLELLPKDKLKVQVGLIQRDNKEFSEALCSGTLYFRKLFIEANNLSERNILSMHNDAVIFISKKKIITQVDDHVNFRCDGTWESYIRYKNLEMFYGNEILGQKGFIKEMWNQHTLGLCKYLLNVFNKLNNYDPTIIQDLRKFQTVYLQDKLPEYYYVAFGRPGPFKLANLQFTAFITNIALKEVRGWG